MTESSTDTKLSMAKFNGQNYHLWKFKMEALLIERGVWDAIDIARPGEGSSSGTDTASTTWKRQDQRARSAIILSITDDQLMHIHGCKTAKEAWDKLKAVHEKQGVANRHYMRRRFLTLRMEGNSMQDHLNRLKRLVGELAAIGAPVSNEDQVYTLLASLPDSYEHLIVALESTADDNLTLEFVSSRLLQEELRRQDGSDTASKKGGKAFFTKNGNQGGKDASWKKTATCHHCNLKGHIKADCRKLKAEQAAQKVGKDQANSAQQPAGAFAFTAGCIPALQTAQGLPSLTPDTWILDSGASQHMTGRRELFSTYASMPATTIEMADSHTLTAVGKGTVCLAIADTENRASTLTLSDCWHVEGMHKNLLCFARLVKAGARLTFNDKGCLVKGPEGADAFLIPEQGCIYALQAKSSIPTAVGAAATTTATCPLALWHQRLGHLNEADILKLNKLATGISVTGSLGMCDTCSLCKATRASFPKGVATRATEPLDLVHSDVWGPMSPPTNSGCRYFVSFIDDNTRMTRVRLMKQKLEVTPHYKDFDAETSTFLRRPIKSLSIAQLRSDPGGEYMSKELDAYLKSKGTKHQLTSVDTPQQNGVAERMNRTLVEMARCLIQQAGLPKQYWGEAIMTACYLRNRSPTSACDKTPYELFYKVAPDLGHLRAFGCVAYAFIRHRKRKKMDLNARKCILLGYSETSKEYRLEEIGSKRIILARSVRFDESQSYRTLQAAPQEPTDASAQVEISSWDPTDSGSVSDTSGSSSSSDSSSDEHEEPPNADEVPSESEEEFQDAREHRSPAPTVPGAPVKASRPDLEVRRSTRVARLPGEFWKVPSTTNASSGKANIAAYAYAAGVKSALEEPMSYKESQTMEDAKLWHAATLVELEAHDKNHTFLKLVPLPAGRKAVGSRWVYKKKMRMDGTIERYKARLVAKGFSQREGVDYTEVYAPVAKFSSVRMVCSLIATEDMEADQSDVVTAFILPRLEEEIYMKQPEGFEDPEHPDWVLLLGSPLYGLKQSAREFNKKVDKKMLRMGLVQSPADPCIYTGLRGTCKIIILIYVDDMIVAASTRAMVDKLKAELLEEFEMKDLGPLRYFLGLEITRNRPKRLLHLSQTRYIINLVEKYNMSNAKPCYTPMEHGLQLTNAMSPATDAERQAMEKVPYRNALGSLVYAMTGTRLDMAAAVGVVSKYLANPGMQHWKAVQRIVRYANTTRMLGISLGGSFSHKDPKRLSGYADADYAGCLDTRRSTTGFLFMFGGPISWQSKRQTSAALSTAEAEYMSLTQAAKEAIWLRALAASLGFPQDVASVIYEDNQGAIALAKNPVSHARTKHIDVRHHFIRDAIMRNEIEVVYLETLKMAADLLTKPIARDQFQALRKICGVGELVA